MAIQFLTRNFLSQGFNNTQKVSTTEFFRMPRKKSLTKYVTSTKEMPIEYLHFDSSSGGNYVGNILKMQ